MIDSMKLILMGFAMARFERNRTSQFRVCDLISLNTVSRQKIISQSSFSCMDAFFAHPECNS